MTILRKLFVLAIAALFLAQFVGVAGGQDANGHDAQRPKKKRLPKPPADNSDITLPMFSLEIKAEKPIAKIGEKLEVEVTMMDADSAIFYAKPFSRIFVERSAMRWEGVRPNTSSTALGAAVHSQPELRAASSRSRRYARFD